MRTLNRVLIAAALPTLLSGCSLVQNQWREDGPATQQPLDSVSAREILAERQPAEQRERGWAQRAIHPVDGGVEHWPSYFEDPFEDKGAGREGLNKYRIGWEDYVAMPYVFARYTLNWLALPASAAVTPPNTIMVSDGRLSRQALGYDHDAARAADEPPTVSEDPIALDDNIVTP